MLITRFALQTVKNPKFQNWFLKNSVSKEAQRRKLPIEKEVFTRTEIYKRSAIPYMMEILNNQEDQ